MGSVRINNQNVTNWQDEDFKVRLGSSFNFICNTNRFTISQITVNDQNLGTSTSWSTTVTDETPINITITAEKKPSFNITFTCEDYNNVMVYNGYGSDESERITLTGETTVFEIPQTGYNFIVVKAADGYRITTLVDDNGNDLNVGSSNYFSADTEVFAVVEEIARPKTFTVYVESDRDMLRDIINNQLLPLMVLHGFPVKGLRFEWADAMDYTPEQQVAYETMIADRYEVESSYFADKYGMPVGKRRNPTALPNPDDNSNEDDGQNDRKKREKNLERFFDTLDRLMENHSADEVARILHGPRPDFFD